MIHLFFCIMLSIGNKKFPLLKTSSHRPTEAWALAKHEHCLLDARFIGNHWCWLAMKRKNSIIEPLCWNNHTAKWARVHSISYNYSRFFRWSMSIFSSSLWYRYSDVQIQGEDVSLVRESLWLRVRRATNESFHGACFFFQRCPLMCILTTQRPIITKGKPFLFVVSHTINFERSVRFDFHGIVLSHWRQMKANCPVERLRFFFSFLSQLYATIVVREYSIE